MFGLRKKTDPYAAPAKSVYGVTLQHIRTPEFYTLGGVPDTFDGRFDLLLLHLFLIIHRLLEDGTAEAQDFNQALFDATFSDMDQTLREMGIGDMGVPKHMRKMMKAFNGRMQGYKMGLESGTLSLVLQKNLYATCAAVPEESLSGMTHYMMQALSTLRTQKTADIRRGIVSLPEFSFSTAGH